MQSSESAYLSRLDHLRFFAALQVLFWHGFHFYMPTAYVPRWWPLSVLEEGHSGVSLFMTLSGFIFYTLCRGKRILYRQFIQNRILRIAPLFFCWSLLMFYQMNIKPVDMFVSIISLLNNGAVPGVGWTIIVEFQFYVIFPFLLLFSQRYGVGYLVKLVLLAVALRFAIYYHDDKVSFLAYKTIFGRIDQFLLGMLAAELYARRPKWLAARSTLIAATTAFIALAHGFNVLGGHSGTEKSSLWVYLPTVEGLSYGLIAAAYLSQSWSLPRYLDKTLGWLGTLSFSYYLCHMTVLNFSYKWLTLAGWLPATTTLGTTAFVFLGVLPLVTLVSAATYYLIERPFLSMRTPYLVPLDDVSHQGQAGAANAKPVTALRPSIANHPMIHRAA